MPYKFQTEKLLIPQSYDKRRKLSEEDKIDIRSMSRKGYSQRELARMYNVSRRLIQFVINPQSLEENKERRKERGGSAQYYDKETHTLAVRKHRNYKKDLYYKKLLENNR
jgi:transposase